MEEDPAREALSVLVRHSMVEWDGETERYRLHNLARGFAQDRVEEGERTDAERRHAAHYVQVLGAADQLFLRGEESILAGLSLFDLERHNIEAGQAWAAARLETNETAVRLCSDYPSAGVYCLSLRLHRQEWMPWLEKAIDSSQRAGDRRGEGNHLGNLGSAYADLGQVARAIEYMEAALTVFEEIKSPYAEQVREQLARLRDRPGKKWWQFWR